MYNPRNFQSNSSLPLAVDYAKEANHAGTLHQLQMGSNRLISLLNCEHLGAVFKTRYGATLTRRWRLAFRREQ
jgi:hypothetical protein